MEAKKARISLARAVYANKDIYLLDDPLSAVDAHVRKTIINDCLLGLLKNKTRVLVTHQLEMATYADSVLIMKDGRVVEALTKNTLQKSKLYKDLLNTEKNKAMGQNQIDLSTEDSSSKLKNSDNENEKESNSVVNELIQSEDTEIGSIKKEVWIGYFKFFGGLKVFGWVCIIMAVRNACTSLQERYNSKMAEEAEFSLTYLATYLVIGLLADFLLFYKNVPLIKAGSEHTIKLHSSMMEKVIQAPIPTFFDRVPIGRILQRFNNDLEKLGINTGFFFSWLITTIFDLVSGHLMFTYVASIYTIPFIAGFLYYARKIQIKYLSISREVNRLTSSSKGPVTDTISEILQGMVSIRAYNCKEIFQKKFFEKQDQNSQNAILGRNLEYWFLMTIANAAAFILIPSLIFILTDLDLKAGDAGFLVTWVFWIDGIVREFMQASSGFESDLIALERCRSFTKIPSEYSQETDNKPELTNWPSQGAIRFDKINLKYRENLPLVLEDLSFDIKPLEKIGIAGRTGSGKSSILLSLLGVIQPTKGSIFIDGIDVSKISLKDLRKSITIIPQDPLIFKGTLRGNLDPFDQHMDIEIWNSLDRVGLSKKFEGDDALKSQLSLQGGNLSAGERQLIMLARAILSKNKIILIDEATSNIDSASENRVLSVISENFSNCTVLTIAHRIETILKSDRIFIMQNGRLVETGSPSKLANSPESTFRNLWDQQLKLNPQTEHI